MNVLVVGDKIECKDLRKHLTVYVNVTWSRSLKFYPDEIAANVIAHYPNIRHEKNWSYMVMEVELPYKAKKIGAAAFIDEIKSKIGEWI